MLDFAKSIKVGNSKKEDIIKEKKSKGVYLKVDNGQKLEFSDGTTYAKSTGSDDYREIHNYVGNAYTRGQALGGNWFINEAKADGSILVSHHPDGRTLEFSSEYELKDWMRNSHIGNESIESQEDKKFEKLGKDAEKEVGNSKYTDKKDHLKEYVLDESTGTLTVYYDGKKVDEMKNAQGWKQKLESIATKTGNTDTQEGNGLDRAFKAMNKKCGNGIEETVKQAMSKIKKFGVGTRVIAEGEPGKVIKEEVQVGPNGIPFGWVTVKFDDGSTMSYEDWDKDLKKA